jgi:hypothetical protein
VRIAALLDRIMDENWVDISTAPDQPPSPEPQTLM